MKSVLKSLSKILMIIALVVLAVLAIGLLTGQITMATTIGTAFGIKFTVGLVLALAGGLAVIAAVLSPKGAMAGLARVAGAVGLIAGGAGEMIGGIASGLAGGLFKGLASKGLFSFALGAACLVGGFVLLRKVLAKRGNETGVDKEMGEESAVNEGGKGDDKPLAVAQQSSRVVNELPVGRNNRLVS